MNGNTCVILFVDRRLTGLRSALMLLFTYVSPERSSIYGTSNCNVISILSDKVTSVLSDFPEALFLIAGGNYITITRLKSCMELYS